MKTKNLLPFHLAIPVNDLEKSRNFYRKLEHFLKPKQEKALRNLKSNIDILVIYS